MPRTRITLLSVALGLASGACFQENKKPEPSAPAVADQPQPSAADLNALAGPVLPKHRSAAPGTAAVLPRLAPNANTPDPHANTAPPPSAAAKASLPAATPPKPAAAEVDPRALLGPLLPKGEPAQKPLQQQQPQAASTPETERVNLDALAAPVLPNSPGAKQAKAVLPKLDQVERDTLSMPDLPAPSLDEDAKVPGAKLAPPPSAAGAAPPPAQLPEATPAAYLITAQGVGALRVGSRLAGSPGFENRYTTSFYADAQPLEGFALDEPPVFVAVSNGPFASWGRAHPGETPPYPIRKRALAMARAGKLRVGMLVVTSQTPKTERGVGVGDDYIHFANAYPKASQPATFPGLWEEPSCVVTQKSLWFFFDRCDSPVHAKLIRIAIRSR
jgi:hypothetical protein